MNSLAVPVDMKHTGGHYFPTALYVLSVKDARKRYGNAIVRKGNKVSPETQTGTLPAARCTTSLKAGCTCTASRIISNALFRSAFRATTTSWIKVDASGPII